jgi:hypothetical protein
MGPSARLTQLAPTCSYKAILWLPRGTRPMVSAHTAPKSTSPESGMDIRSIGMKCRRSWSRRGSQTGRSSARPYGGHEGDRDNDDTLGTFFW